MTEDNALINAALAGDEEALEALLRSVQDTVFNLALRMLGTVPDAEDATQEVLVKALTRLSSFRRESSFSTWVFRIALNHLSTYRKGLFAQRPVSFDVYGEDIASGRERDVPDLTGGVDRLLLERELKLSCMNGMLQCLDVDGRSAFVLGTMFKMDSRAAADALGITPEAYRQRLSRARARMSEFLTTYCGVVGGTCQCARRVDYSIATHRVNPERLDWQELEQNGAATASADAATVAERTDAMERLDEASGVFSALPDYRCPESAVAFARSLVASDTFSRAVTE